MKDISVNQHLNLFHFFNENSETKYLEKNLTRALALCLKHDFTFQYAFLRDILSPEDFDKVFYTHEEDSFVSIDLEKETNSLVESTTKLYAIGLTDSPINEDWSNILNEVVQIEKANFTDLVLSIKDLKIIIEVKKYNHDCREQLRQQIAPFLNAQNSPKSSQVVNIETRHLSWATLIASLEKINHFYEYNELKPHYVKSFLHLIKTRFPHWIPTKPFMVLAPMTGKNDKQKRHDLDRRLLQSINTLGTDKVKHFWDRTAINVNRPWATEAIPEFMVDSIGIQYLAVRIWPGNTKQQGYSLYGGSLDWTKQKYLIINGEQYDIHIERHIKFMHFNKYITSIDIAMEDTDQVLVKEINTHQNHHHGLAGKWDRIYWPNLDAIFKEHVKDDWKKLCRWDEEFENSDRSYLTLALGYAVTLYIPYDKLQALDKLPNDHHKVGIFLEHCKDAIVGMVDGTK